MDFSYFKDKKITVLGLGLHGGGVGIVKFLVNHGSKVVVTDLKTKEQLASSIEKLKGLKNIEYVLGQHRNEDFVKTDMVIKNPSVSWDSQHIKLALQNKIPVEMDSSLFFKLCKNPIIGVTGTKGKTTTSALIFEILKLAGKNPVKVGSGQISVLDKLDILNKDSAVVFELSSWRLSALKKEKLSPHIAVITNILRDHQNYYKNMEEYLADKKNIFLFQKPSDWLIINDDSEKLKEIYPEVKSQIFKFSFSPADGSSVFVENENIFVNNGVDTKKVIEIKGIKILGKHNIYNAMAAIGATFAFGVKIEEIRKAIADFSGVPHRLELVKEKNGIKFYNDAAASIPESVLEAIGSFNESIILITGGEGKNFNFSDIAENIIKKVKKIILLKGNATDNFIGKIGKDSNNSNFEIADSIEESLHRALHFAEKGDIIIFSPGCSNFGSAYNYIEKGESFIKVVNSIKV